MSSVEKKLCVNGGGLVPVSQHNDNGCCPCMNCVGLNCHVCSVPVERNATYASYRENLLRCARCRGLLEKQR